MSVGRDALAGSATGPMPGLLSAGARLPLLIAPATASTLLLIALALAIFKPGWRLRSSSTAGADASPRTQTG